MPKGKPGRTYHIKDHNYFLATLGLRMHLRRKSLCDKVNIRYFISEELVRNYYKGNRIMLLICNECLDKREELING